MPSVQRRRTRSRAASTSGPSSRVSGHDAVAVVRRHVQHAVREVAEVVREVAVVAGDHRLVAEVAVGAEALVRDEVVAEAVDAEVGDEVGRARSGSCRVLLIFSPPTSRKPCANTCFGGASPAAISIAGQYTAC